MVAQGALQSAVIFGALIVLILGARTYRMVKGTPLNPARLFLFTAFYVVLFALLVGEVASLLPTYLLVADTILLVVTLVVALPYVRREITVYARADGQWMYRMGPLIPAIYLVLFLVRLAIDVSVLNESFAGPPVLTPLTLPGQVALAIVDGLFAFSTGLLTARSIGVYQEYEAMRRRPSPPSPTSGSPAPLR
ncbi:MAG: hypothetical protein ACREDK_01025 [Thermoplasmata archaeon]